MARVIVGQAHDVFALIVRLDHQIRASTYCELVADEAGTGTWD